MASTRSDTTQPDDELRLATEATLRASRALVGIVARSLGSVLDHVSLPQFRVLVLLSSGGPARSGSLAEQLGVHPSTFTRMTDRLVAAGWVERRDAPDNRREVYVALTESGAALVDEVMDRRRATIASVLEPLDSEHRQAVLRGLEVLALAAGEPEVQDMLTLAL